MAQPQSDPAPAFDPVPEDRSVDEVEGTTSSSESPLQAGLAGQVSQTDPAAANDVLTDELASRIESLRMFFSEQTEGAGVQGGRPLTDSTGGSASRSETPHTVSMTAGVDARATMDAIRKLSEQLVTLPALNELHNVFDQRLVRAEQALHRIEDLLADRTLAQLCARVDEGLVRTEEMLRRIDTTVAARAAQQLSARIEARLANAEDAVTRIERLVEGGSLREIAAQSHEKLARIEADLRRLERLIQRDSRGLRTALEDPAKDGAAAPRVRRSTWIAGLRRVDVRQLARRAAAAFVLLGVIAIASMRYEPEPSARLLIPSHALRVRPVPVFLAPALSAPPVDELFSEEASAELPSDVPIRAPSRTPAAVRAVLVRSDTLYVGTLRVASNPAGASVFVNGRAVGTTPLTLSEQRVGSLALQITRDGFQRWTAAVQVSAGQSTQVNATLRPENP